MGEPGDHLTYRLRAAAFAERVLWANNEKSPAPAALLGIDHFDRVAPSAQETAIVQAVHAFVADELGVALPPYRYGCFRASSLEQGRLLLGVTFGELRPKLILLLSPREPQDLALTMAHETAHLLEEDGADMTRDERETRAESFVEAHRAQLLAYPPLRAALAMPAR